MTYFRMRGVGRGLRALAAGTLLIGASAAAAQQAVFPPGAVVQALPDRDTGEALRDQLSRLAENPRSPSALVDAGRAALAMGDVQAALSFFARADEVAPRDARVKAGMGSALARMEQGRAALGLFNDAVALGAPVIEIAADRGLAYELVGDPGRAQQDYALFLSQRDDPEVRRRLALSLAISGKRDQALATIDAQLRAQDRAAWRTRALILAVTGDAAGANEAAKATMPPVAAQAMAPFLARLAQLDPAQKAMAVHFGRFPTDPGAVRMASAAAPNSAAATAPQSVPARTAPAQPVRVVSNETARPQQTGIPSADAVRARAQLPVPPVRSQPQPAPGGEQARQPDAEPGFDRIASLVASLPAETKPIAAPKPVAQKAPPAAAKKQEKKTAAPAPPAHPARHWVQIAGGADKKALPREFARLAGLAPDLLRGRTAYTTPLRFTNRLLVGPFDDEAEAQAFVNRLAAKEVSAFAWTSPAGQEIERLRARK